MKKHSLWIMWLVVFLVSSCQTQKLNMGVAAFDRGQYDIAAGHWNQIAIDGNPEAQYNLGLLWESGLGTTAKNPTEAAAWFAKSATQGYVPAMVKLAKIQLELDYKEQSLSWYVMAARWGNNEAIVELGKMGVTIPASDLLYQQQRSEEAATLMIIDSLNSSAYALGCAVSGGSCTKPGDLTPKPITPALINTNKIIRTNTDGINSVTPSVLSNSLNSCTSDYSCGIGFRCVKESYGNTGTCMKNVNEYGTQIFDSPDPSSIGVNVGQGCMASSCPIGFRCDIATKACIK